MSPFAALPLLAVLASLTSLASASVVPLTQATFDKTVSSNRAVLVEFYAPWCPSCKALQPEYEKLGNSFSGQGVTIAKVDAIADEALADKHGVESYPTVKLYKNGKQDCKYEGDRTSEALSKWLTSKTAGGGGGGQASSMLLVEEVEGATLRRGSPRASRQQALQAVDSCGFGKPNLDVCRKEKRPAH